MSEIESGDERQDAKDAKVKRQEEETENPFFSLLSSLGVLGVLAFIKTLLPTIATGLRFRADESARRAGGRTFSDQKLRNKFACAKILRRSPLRFWKEKSARRSRHASRFRLTTCVKPEDAPEDVPINFPEVRLQVERLYADHEGVAETRGVSPVHAARDHDADDDPAQPRLRGPDRHDLPSADASRAARCARSLARHASAIIGSNSGWLMKIQDRAEVTPLCRSRNLVRVRAIRGRVDVGAARSPPPPAATPQRARVPAACR